MAKYKTFDQYKASQKRRQLEKSIGLKPKDEPNYDVECDVCSCTPTVGNLGLCGPCCFGDSSTVNGNW